MAAEESNSEQNSVMLLGRDVTKIPCFRGTMLNGACGGVIGAMVSIMFLRKPHHVLAGMFAAFWITAFSYWTVCRYRILMEKKMWDNIKLEEFKPSRLPDSTYIVPPSSTFKESEDTMRSDVFTKKN